ncbi:anti-sigma-I factor RsgI2-like [Palaemon carinicauda]|uniref:anti-sigma-I factor RsgI2-like n=1 Tax=Palaemon carinicauda TaxID=392227 RepID=UPI0035B5B61E
MPLAQELVMAEQFILDAIYYKIWCRCDPCNLEELLKTLDNPASSKRPKSITPPSTSPAPYHITPRAPATNPVSTFSLAPVGPLSTSPAPQPLSTSQDPGWPPKLKLPSNGKVPSYAAVSSITDVHNTLRITARANLKDDLVITPKNQESVIPIQRSRALEEDQSSEVPPPTTTLAAALMQAPSSAAAGALAQLPKEQRVPRRKSVYHPTTIPVPAIIPDPVTLIVPTPSPSLIPPPSPPSENLSLQSHP